MKQASGLRSYADAQFDTIRHSESWTNPERRIHALRVSAKRLRSILRLLQDLNPEAKGLRALLGKISHRLEPYREADVLRHTLTEFVPEKKPAAEKADPTRDKKFLKIAEDFLALVPHLHELIDDERYRQKDLRRCVETSLKKWQKAYRRAKESGEDVAFHDLRKRGKDIQYQCEAVFAHEAEKPLRALKNLAETLGDAHDLFMFEQQFDPKAAPDPAAVEEKVRERKAHLYAKALKRAKKVRAKARDLFADL